MNRREFVKGGVNLAAAATIVNALDPMPNVLAGAYEQGVGKPPAALSKTLIEYKGRLLWWTGWKPCYNGTLVAGQWTTWDGKHPLLYASIPGDAGEYKAGQQFNLTRRAGQHSTYYEDFLLHPETMDEARDEALERIKRLIDART